MNPTPSSYAEQIEPGARAWLDCFRETDAWLVCPHMKPDADTLGSALAMAKLLRALGRKVWVACADPVVERYGFLAGAHDVVVGRLPADLPPHCGVVTLDAADFERLGAMAPLVADMRPFVNLDHHISNPGFGSHNWVDTASAATGELVFLLYQFFGVPIERDAATALYAALVTDTGFFRYPATTPRTLAIAGELVACGVDFPGLIAQIYERQSAGAVRLAGLALSKFQLEAGGRVAWTSISSEMFAAADASEDDAEGIIEELRKIEGVQILYILRESLDGPVRVSLRAKPGFDVNAIARAFGGGGHVLAAGCTIAATLSEAEAQLRAVVLSQLVSHQTNA